MLQGEQKLAHNGQSSLEAILADPFLSSSFEGGAPGVDLRQGIMSEFASLLGVVIPSPRGAVNSPFC